MKNMNELRVALSEVFADLRSGAIEVARADASANIAGKMILSAKLQAEYNRYVDNHVNKDAITRVDFLEAPSTGESQ